MCQSILRPEYSKSKTLGYKHIQVKDVAENEKKTIAITPGWIIMK